jgi:hypothetical protein
VAIYAIWLKGQLDPAWAEQFDPMTTTNCRGGLAVLTGDAQTLIARTIASMLANGYLQVRRGSLDCDDRSSRVMDTARRCIRSSPWGTGGCLSRDCGA